MQFTVRLPDWAIEAQSALRPHYPTLEERMRLVIEFARKNVEHQSGGPFAAGIFERDSGRPVLIGVNRVIPCNVSSAHAEIVALSLAQQRLGHWNLGGEGIPTLQLVVNWRPCAMCFGAVLWSGIRSLAIAGSDEACERITGFDEGPIHPEWRSELAKRDIELHEPILYQEAIAVFHAFRDSGCEVYNGRPSIPKLPRGG